MIDLLLSIAWNSWLVLGQMAPYLLFGFLVAGLLSVWVSPRFVERHLGGGYGGVIKAAVFGVPLPLCSCGVIPVSASLRRHGASRAATASFLLSTPQTGVDSIAATWAMLGPLFAVFRPIAALASGLLGGGLVQLFAESEGSRDGQPAGNACTEPCCVPGSVRNPLLRALRYGFITLPRDIGWPLLVGVVIAGAITAFFPTPPEQLRPILGGGPIAMLVMVAVGIPIYVCATASVPIARGFIYLGASPGAALAFLIAGPATNAATVATVWKVLGRRTAVLYLLTIVLAAVGCGLALDWLFGALQVQPPHLALHNHQQHSWLIHVWAVGLLAVLALSFWRQRPQAAPAEGAAPAEPTASAPQRLELSITGMRCSHCVDSVTRALGECRGVQKAEVSLQPGSAVVHGRDLDPAELRSVIAFLGYSATVNEAPN